MDDLVIAIGAVNTIVRLANGQLHGENTDWLAIYNLLRDQVANRKNIVGLVLGAGGTAHAACYALSKLGITFYIHNRTFEKARILADKYPVSVFRFVNPF